MEEEFDIKEIVLILWRKKFFIIITTLIFGIISFLGFGIKNNIIQNFKNTKNSEKLYYAETRFIVGTAEIANSRIDETVLNNTAPITITETTRVISNDALIDTYCELIKSRTSLNNVITELKLDIDANTLSHLISFSPIKESNVLSIVVAYKDETTVIQITNKLMDEFIKTMSKAYSIDQVSVIDKAYLMSNTDIANCDSISQIENASSAAKNAIINTLKYSIVSAILGIIFSVSIVLFIEIFDGTIKNEESLNNLLTTLDKTDNQNTFALLRLQLSEAKTLLITSVDKKDNTTYISTNLANEFAKLNSKVLLLDLTSDDSILIKKYDCNGLLDYINDDNKDINKFISKSTVNNFDILSIDSNTNTYLNELQLEKLLNSLENTYDKIIINSKNILESSNTLIISKIIENTIIVTTERNTKLAKYNEATRIVNKLSGNIINTILIK